MNSSREPEPDGSQVRLTPPKRPWLVTFGLCLAPFVIVGIVTYTGLGGLLPLVGLLLLANKTWLIKSGTKWWMHHIAKNGRPVTGVIKILGAKRLLGERMMTVCWNDDAKQNEHQLVVSTQLATHYQYVEGGDVRLWICSSYFWPCHLVDALLFNAACINGEIPSEWIPEYNRPSSNGVARLTR